MKFVKNVYNYLNIDFRYFIREMRFHKSIKSINNLSFGFEKIRFNRIAAVNHSISLINKEKNDISYLEIGCNENNTFDSLPLLNKIGVDPIKGGNIRMTSDDFFSSNFSKFDLIFIDGFHSYHQVKKDLINSCKCLNESGIILMHDFLPSNWKSAISNQEVQLHPLWNGDCYKLSFELLDAGIEFKILRIDHGILLIDNESSVNKISLMDMESNSKYKDLTFDYYFKNLRYLPIVEFTEWVNDNT
jgi:hypothetical protein